MERSVVKALEVPIDVLLKYSNGFNEQMLFPNPEEDLIYKALLSTPFEIIETVDSNNFFYQRALPIPEYGYVQNHKILPANYGFYNFSFFLEPSDEHSIFQVPASFLNHTEIDEQVDFSNIEDLIIIGDRWLVEARTLLKLPAQIDSSKYFKGVHFTRLEDNLYSLGGIIVDHPGTMVNDIVFDAEWFYILQYGKFKRVSNVNECKCKDYRKHTLEFTVLKKLYLHIIEEKISQIQDLNILFKTEEQIS